MERAVYAVEAKVEANHWWFRGRRRLFRVEIDRLGLAPHAAVLDLGSGTGANIRLLRQMGIENVTGIDSSVEAAAYCASKGLGPVECGDICSIPFRDQQFDVVLATDVIEHVDDDNAALRETLRILKPGGFALITVPAFESLWGLQDRMAHHKRRYRIKQLRRAVEQAGFEVIDAYYFNYMLFPFIWLARRAIDILKPAIASENEINSPFVNWVLTYVFAADVSSARWLRPPIGVSALVLARRPAA